MHRVDVLGEPCLRLATREGKWVVAGMVLGSAVTYVSATVVNVALPAIGDDLHADLAGLQWVTNAYLMTLAALVLTGGSAGDIFGRRRVFLIGVIGFMAASVLCAAAPNLQLLIAGRLVQGVGAALMTPASLAIIDASFDPEDKTRAIAAWASGSALASSVGPFAGGWIVDAAGWRWVFLITLPLAAFTVWATIAHVPESRDGSAGRRLDMVGSALAVVAVAGVVYALVQGPEQGWRNGTVIGAAVTGTVAGAAFILSQQRERDPMLPLRLFLSRQFSGANLYTLLVYLAISGAFFFLALQLQTVLGYSALEAGAGLVPLNVVMVLGAPKAGALAGRVGARPLVTSGSVVMAVAFAWMSRIGPGAHYLAEVLPPVLVLGAGMALMVAPLTSSVLGSVEPHDVGIASAVNNAVARTGGLLATAALPFAAGLSGKVDAAAFDDGYQRALLMCAGLCTIGAAIAAATIGRGVATHTTVPSTPTSGCDQRSLPDAA
jgi:EmrB/QacA subfamily drug resistance transporter